MATPHVAGGMAIVTQYVEDNFPGLSTRERQAMVDRILMSTATPVIEAGGTYAAVMDQGAGEMNLAKGCYHQGIPHRRRHLQQPSEA